jgi:hypothetical protein
LASSRGDILIGIQNRIDIINYALYLPPGYIKTVQAMTWKEKTSEQPITFDESFDFLKNYAARRHIHSHHHNHPGRSETHRYDQFHKLNFLTNDLRGLDNESNMEGEFSQCDGPKGWGASMDDLVYRNLMVRLNSLMERRNKIIKSEKHIQELELIQIEKTVSTSTNMPINQTLNSLCPKGSEATSRV